MRRGFHATATCGVYGAAAAAGKRLRLPEATLVRAMAIVLLITGAAMALQAIL